MGKNQKTILYAFYCVVVLETAINILYRSDVVSYMWVKIAAPILFLSSVAVNKIESAERTRIRKHSRSENSRGKGILTGYRDILSLPSIALYIAWFISYMFTVFY